MTRTGKRAVVAVALLAAAAALVWATGLLSRKREPAELTLVFRPFVGAEPLVLNEGRYPNPGGGGQFSVRDLQFLLSQFRLAGNRDTWAEPDSYHLVRFDGEVSEFRITLRGMPPGDYDRIEFGIGVDADANHSLESRGDLDPNSRMAWTWEVGYKFVLFEGALEHDGRRTPLVYHVGFDENYKQLSADLEPGLIGGAGAAMAFRVDVLRLFTGQSTVDMAALPSVKFERGDSALLARNYAVMISPMPRRQAYQLPVQPRGRR